MKFDGNRRRGSRSGGFAAGSGMMSIAAGVCAMLLGSLFVPVVATDAGAQESQRGVRYNCQNGAQMTVIFLRDTAGKFSLRYIYDGPESAMRTMQLVGDPSSGRFVDGENKISILNNNAMTISYTEGSDLFDTCNGFEQF